MRLTMTEDYCKLASGIILSTIWREDDHTRLLWITMLAVKDRHHRVLASLPGLAAVANIPLESCRVGLQKLSQPDKYSRTKEHEGRRIQEIDGGWSILNGEKYRNYMSKAERNEYQAKLMAKRRAEEKLLAPVSKKLAPLAQAEAEAEAEAFQPEEPTSSAPASPALSGFAEFWSAYPKRIGKGNAEKAWRKLGCAKLLPQILVAVRACKVSEDWTKEAGQFIPHPATWLNRRGWEDELVPQRPASRSGEWLRSKPKQVPKTAGNITFLTDATPEEPQLMNKNLVKETLRKLAEGI